MPNQFREIIKSSLENSEEVWNDVNKTLFWKGYQVWKKRKISVSNLWKNILPEEWNKSSNTKARQKAIQESMCQDPFHFYQKLFAYSSNKITKCSCSKVLLSKRSRTGDIRHFLTKVPRITNVDPVSSRNSLIHPVDSPDTSINMQFITREDKIRGECDRKKKRRS
jgi:hypothetical protein